MKTFKNNREASLLFEEILKPRNIDYHIVVGGKHPKLVFEHLGKPVKYVFPGSPSDHRAIKNMKSGILRIISEIEGEKKCIQ